MWWPTRDADMNTARNEVYHVGTSCDEGGSESMAGWLDEISRSQRWPLSDLYLDIRLCILDTPAHESLQRC